MIATNIATASGHAVSLVQWYQLEKVEIEKSRNYTLYAMILSCHCSTIRLFELDNAVKSQCILMCEKAHVKYHP